MAKAKPTKAPKSPSASESKSKKSATKTVTPKATTGKKSSPQPATPKPEFTHIAIGHTAGDIWGVLSTDGPKTITELKKSVQASGDVVVAAVGWLAREDKLEYITTGKTVKIGLR